MAKVKQLKQAIRKFKKENCPAISRMKKPSLIKLADSKGVKLKLAPRRKRK